MRRSFPIILLLLTLSAALAQGGMAHPANIPIARAKVSSNGLVHLTLTFDLLAFVLDQTPSSVLDPPMNALLDADPDKLSRRLSNAKGRFLEGFSVSGGAFRLKNLEFPTVAQIKETAGTDSRNRLPLMMTLTLDGSLLPGTRTIKFQFPDVLGPVVLTTEFPYREPIVEPVEPGTWSIRQTLPSEQETLERREAMNIRPSQPTTSVSTDLAGIRAAIGHHYASWSKAYMEHDLTTLFDILAPEYVLTTAKGKSISLGEYKAMLLIRKQKHSDTKAYRTEILRLTLQEGVAAVWSRETTTETGPTSTSDPISYQHDYIDVWKSFSGKWKLVRTLTQAESKLQAK